MPASTLSSTNTQPKTLKWAIQRTPKKSTSGGKIQKQTRVSHSCKSNSALPSTAYNNKKKPKGEMERLASELAFTYDTLATISVHFESLQLAYTSSKADLKKQYCPTRLGPKEKELLAAYDDLGLQVLHLERKIKKLETRLEELRRQEQEKKNNDNTTPSPKPVSIPANATLLSPASSTCSFNVSPSTSADTAFYMDDANTITSSVSVCSPSFGEYNCFYPSHPLLMMPTDMTAEDILLAESINLSYPMMEEDTFYSCANPALYV